MSNFRPVLIVEDEPDDAALIRVAFADKKTVNPLRVVANGEDAIRYLAGTGVYADRRANPLPVLILLDLKLPVKDGFDVLRWLTEHPEIQRESRVVVLTSSVFPEDIAEAHKLGAQDVLEKPFRYDDLVQVIGELKSKWLGGDEPER